MSPRRTFTDAELEEFKTIRLLLSPDDRRAVDAEVAGVLYTAQLGACRRLRALIAPLPAAERTQLTAFLDLVEQWIREGR